MANILCDLLFSWFLIMFHGTFLGLNYFQMANYWFLMDSNTFWMISGTSNMFTKSGPVDPVFITKMLHEIKEKYRIMLKPIICSYLTILNSTISKKTILPDVKHVELCGLFMFSFCFFWGGVNLVSLKQLVSPSVFKEFSVVEFQENLEIWKS